MVQCKQVFCVMFDQDTSEQVTGNSANIFDRLYKEAKDIKARDQEKEKKKQEAANAAGKKVNEGVVIERLYNAKCGNVKRAVAEEQCSFKPSIHPAPGASDSSTADGVFDRLTKPVTKSTKAPREEIPSFKPSINRSEGDDSGAQEVVCSLNERVVFAHALGWLSRCTGPPSPSPNLSQDGQSILFLQRGIPHHPLIRPCAETRRHWSGGGDGVQG